MVIDYRNLNAKTKTYNYPIPNKILKIRQIQGYNYFSKFDCKSGFYNLKVEDESKKLTVFTVPQGFISGMYYHLDIKMHPVDFNILWILIFQNYIIA